ncbi:LnmK family bifunctional acyltransferase/decarboxylase [Streptomyces sp. NPDC000134]|uniref:LnmK family bifunctional acyltransferase/decarboxylase n=1 Tax=Streptomyces sp. NPDC000134 TaxID=3364536 RepID=UPI00369A2E69
MTSPVTLRAPVLLDGSCVARHVTVSPHMCGGSSSIFAQLGDWTWETVAATCGTNVYDAHTADGLPAYLSFYYFHVRGTAEVHPHGLTFGDELTVTSRSFDFGGESVLTLHRLTKAGPALDVLDPVEFYERPRADSLYVQNFNRWISRGRPDSNEALVQSSPPDFRHDHLPVLPERHSPRGIASRARKNGTFHPDGVPGHVAGEELTTEYDLDVVHDFNGVGLLYFASYFSIIDTALLRLWRRLGRTDREFLARRVLDHKLGYFGNADFGARLTIGVRLWHHGDIPGDETADITVREARSGRLLAVCAIHLRRERA